MSQNSQIVDRPVASPLPHITAVLNYLGPMSEPPVYYISEPPSGIPRDNATYAAHTLPIWDARSIAQDLSLDREGFALITHASAVGNFYNQNAVRTVYYAEAEQLLQQVIGADRVVVFDHNLRNSQRQKQGNGVQEPVKRVHNDFTAKSGYTRARLVLESLATENTADWLQRRFAIVNVWRPIAAPVHSSPLAVCDAQSIAAADLVVKDLIYDDRVGETYALTYNPAHRWFYFPQMQQHEVLLIKCFDSAEAGPARFAAHTAFNDPTSLPNAPARESIELRALVFYA